MTYLMTTTNYSLNLKHALVVDVVPPLGFLPPSSNTNGLDHCFQQTILALCVLVQLVPTVTFNMRTNIFNASARSPPIF